MNQSVYAKTDTYRTQAMWKRRNLDTTRSVAFLPCLEIRLSFMFLCNHIFTKHSQHKNTMNPKTRQQNKKRRAAKRRMDWTDGGEDKDSYILLH